MSGMEKWIGLATLILAIQAGVEARAGLIVGNSADAEINDSGSLMNAGATSLRVGSQSDTEYSVILVFDLSSVSGPLGAADLTVHLESRNPNVIDVDLYGVGFNSSASFPGTADFNNSAADANATLLQANFATDSTATPGDVHTSLAGETALLAYLNARPSGSAGNYVFLRLSESSVGNGNKAFVLTSANATADRPTLSLTPLGDSSPTVSNPEPSTMAGAAVGILTALGCAWRRRRRAAA